MASKEATTNGKQMLKRLLGSSLFFHIQFRSSMVCWKDFWVHDFFTYNLGPQWYVGLLFVIYAPSPIHKSTFEAMVCPRSLAFSIWILFDLWLGNISNCPNFVLIKNKQYKCLNFCLFVCLFCFVLFCKYDMRHESTTPTSQITPSNEISQWIRLRLKLSLSKKPTQGKKEKW
jgi:hypothetical protein